MVDQGGHWNPAIGTEQGPVRCLSVRNLAPKMGELGGMCGSRKRFDSDASNFACRNSMIGCCGSENLKTGPSGLSTNLSILPVREHATTPPHRLHRGQPR